MDITASTYRLARLGLCGLLLLVNTAQAGVQIQYVVNDHLGTPQMLVDEQQHVVWQAGNDPFGNSPPVVEQVEFNLRFPGQYYDKETGLHYNYYRDYDPSTGRYVQSDPIGALMDYADPQMQTTISIGALSIDVRALGALNDVYGYVEGNPVHLIDPDGLHPSMRSFERQISSAVQRQTGLNRKQQKEAFNELPKHLLELTGCVLVGYGKGESIAAASKQMAFFMRGKDAAKYVSNIFKVASGPSLYWTVYECMCE